MRGSEYCVSAKNDFCDTISATGTKGLGVDFESPSVLKSAFILEHSLSLKAWLHCFQASNVFSILASSFQLLGSQCASLPADERRFHTMGIYCVATF